jgi:predicted aspartyl protease
MSLYRVNVVAANIADQQRATPPIQALVNSGSELSWLPSDVLQAIAVSPVRNRTFRTATGQTVQRPIGYAILRAEGFETIDEVVFAEPGDATLLGVRTLEGFGVTVDYMAHRFVATTTIVAIFQPPS